MGSEQNRFPQQERSKKWGGCWGGFSSCFGVQKGGGKRIVPAARTPEGSTAANQANGVGGLTNQGATSLAPHLLAPPSSPASFTNSALPSTAQSPSCHLSISSSANSPGGPSSTSTMFVTGPYAHETQLVTPPVFSTFTTEPSTAPFTPPPELAHLTTPSSPDVPFAQFLSSSADLKCNGIGKTNYVVSNDLQTTYPLSPGSPASSLISPVSPKTSKYPRTGSGWLASNASKSQDSNFFCPATFAQFYLDQPHSGGRLSISKDSDVYPNTGSGNQSKQNKNIKQDVEEIEAYRASFGFSADEMITTTQYVEISDVMDDSFTMMPCTSNKPHVEETSLLGWGHGGSRAKKSETNSPSEKSTTSGSDINGTGIRGIVSSNQFEDSQSTPGDLTLTDEDDIFSDTRKIKNRKYHVGLSCSDAEIEYRRGRSLRECRGDLTWH